jgi:hypothetical protein
MRISCVAALARAWALLAPLGCAEPSIDALVVWVDSEVDQDGSRRLRVYEAGERTDAIFRPLIPGSDVDLLQLGVDGRGGGFVVSGRRRTSYFELGEGGGRHGQLDASVAGPPVAGEPTASFVRDFTLTRNDDAVLREIVPSTDVRRFGLLPVAGSRAMRPVLLREPGPAPDGWRWALHSASDAPVLVFTQVTGSPLHPDGEVVVVGYPGAQWPGEQLSDVVELSRGRLTGRAIDDAAGLGRLSGEHCPNRVCVSPSGRVVYTMALSPCAVLRWDWTQAAPGAAAPPQTRIEIPADACVAAADPFLVAVLDDDTVVLDDDARIYTYQVPGPGRPGVARSVPKIGEGLQRFVRRERGATYVYLSPAGEMIRVDRTGPRIVSTERSACTVDDGFAVSPDGAWAVLACGVVTDATGIGGGDVVRISSLGLEQYFGISMLPLAIDDDGAALLYSYDRDESPEDRVPRGLFVLDGDGQLSRVDELEPAPASVAAFDDRLGRVETRFVAVARE